MNHVLIISGGIVILYSALIISYFYMGKSNALQEEAISIFRQLSMRACIMSLVVMVVGLSGSASRGFPVDVAMCALYGMLAILAFFTLITFFLILLYSGDQEECGVLH